jgi:hypothetical protein
MKKLLSIVAMFVIVAVMVVGCKNEQQTPVDAPAVPDTNAPAAY